MGVTLLLSVEVEKMSGLWMLNDGPSAQTACRYKGVAVQLNPVKEYRHGKRQFFVRVVLLDDSVSEYLCMFNEVHWGKFKTGDLIAFDASVSPARKRGDPDWYRISAKKKVENLGTGKIAAEEKEFDVYYVSHPKEREGRAPSSFGMVGEDWPLELPVSVMEAFFTGLPVQEKAEDVPVNVGGGLYAVLRIPQSAGGKDIKSAYRKFARLYHPDVSDLPDAKERFQEINDAYETLSDPLKRDQHDGWLKLMGKETFVSATGTKVSYMAGQFFNPPHRCGVIRVIGDRLGSRWCAKKILSWEVREKELVVEVPLQEIGYRGWGIEVEPSFRIGFIPGRFASVQHGGFEIDNAQLPFKSTKEINRRKQGLVGMLKVTVRGREMAMWNKPFNKPIRFWDVEQVLSVVVSCVGILGL